MTEAEKEVEKQVALEDKIPRGSTSARLHGFSRKRSQVQGRVAGGDQAEAHGHMQSSLIRGGGGRRSGREEHEEDRGVRGKEGGKAGRQEAAG